MQDNLLEYSWVATGVVLALLAVTILWRCTRITRTKSRINRGN